MGTAPLSPVVKVNNEKCINCYACIDACPVKYCIDGSGEKLEINSDLCIGCGNCIAVCPHKARESIDDFPHFLGDLKYGQKMIAIVAPAIASVFPEKYLNVNGYLKSLGVETIFDVSFGAELTVRSYIDHLLSNSPRMIVAQPCPAIVNYIEIYQPKLLPYLAPAESPMLHSIKMIREYFPQYKNHKIAVISPCIAKRREFDETGLGDYNATMLSLKKHFENNNINLSSFPAIPYEGPKAERAVRFSTPGGLLDTAERFVPGIRRRTRKIEGTNIIYPFLNELAEMVDSKVKISPLVDCLNCEKGCNGGPGTGNRDKSIFILEGPIQERSAKLEEYHKGQKGEWVYRKQYHKMLNKFWKKGLYKREYRDLSDNNNIKEPNEAELQKIYLSMKKYSDADIFNCTGCGYGRCKSMATAIHNNLNKPENCTHYNMAALVEEKQIIEEMNVKLKEQINDALGLIEGINNVVNDLNSKVDSQKDAMAVSSTVTEKMVSAIQNTSRVSQNKQDSINELIGNASKGQESMQDTIKSVQGISQSVEGISAAIKIISAIAANTNLLAMNAAIEAAHAGEAGRGFAVVADEIRKLSETTRENSRNISQTLSNIIQGITITSKRSEDTDKLINEMSVEINGFADMINNTIKTFNELSTEGVEITNALGSLRTSSSEFIAGYAEMLKMTDKLRSDMNNLANVASEKTLEAESL